MAARIIDTANEGKRRPNRNILTVAIVVAALLLVVALAVILLKPAKPRSSGDPALSGADTRGMPKLDLQAIIDKQAGAAMNSQNTPTSRPSGLPAVKLGPDGRPLANQPLPSATPPNVPTPADVTQLRVSTTPGPTNKAVTETAVESEREKSLAARRSSDLAFVRAPGQDSLGGLLGSAARGVLGDSGSDPIAQALAALNQMKPGGTSGAPDIADTMRRALGGAAGAAGASPVAGADRLRAQDDLVRGLSVEAKKPLRETSSPGPNTLFQGAIIPCATKWAINTDVAGDVVCVVTENVFDTLSQSNLLIPMGSEIVGKYQSQVFDGQSRLAIAFSRLRLTDGRSVWLEGMSAIDPTGRAGIEANVDSHLLPRFGTALLSATIAFGFDRLNSRFNQPAATTTTINVGGANAGATTASRIIENAANNAVNRLGTMPPTLTVARGTRIMIDVNRDIAIAPIGS